MTKIIKKRVHAKIEGDFVVFIIGMRPNSWWKLHKWGFVAAAMPRMLKELYSDPSSGFLGSMGGFPFMVQYWRSFEQLAAYARNRDVAHFPAWVRFNKEIGSSGEVGIFHETYLVKDGQYETVYNNMPPMGLGKFTERIVATGKYGSSRSRVGKSDVDDSPVTPDGALVD